MQRLLRIKDIFLTPDFEENLTAEIDLLRRHLPPSIYQMYAQPKLTVDGASIHLDWLSAIVGIIKPYRSLAQHEKTLYWQQMKQSLEIMHAFYAELIERNRSEDAARLSALLIEPKPEQLYIINNKLVIAQWKIAALSKENAFKQNYAAVAHLIPAPEFVLIIDTSGSMSFNVSISTQDEQWANSSYENTPQNKDRLQKLLQEPSRLTIAKQAVCGLLQHLHSKIAIRLISFNGKGAPIDHGVFTSDQRPTLKAHIEQLKSGGKTPLLQSVLHAASQVDGVNNDALTLAFIDGQDSSQINLQQTTQYLKNNKPRLRINIIDVSAQGLSDALAHDTGGRVYKSKNAKKIVKDILKSTNEISAKPSRKA